MTTTHHLEDVFVTEGVPEFTFVSPPNYGAILVDVRRSGKPVIIEGQSGTGKTTVVKKIIREISPKITPIVLTPREPADVPIIEAIPTSPDNSFYIIDDFHRLRSETKDALANLAKTIAERDNRDGLPKLVIIGINEVGSDLIQMVPDVAKRMGIHRVSPGRKDEILKVIAFGEEKLNVKFENKEELYKLSEGDYWLTQQLCKSICISNQVFETKDTETGLSWTPVEITSQVTQALAPNYDPPVKEFCRGRRFRPTNDPYFKLLRAISEQERSSVDLNEIANSQPAIKGSINNVKDRRLRVLLDEKSDCARLFYYDEKSKNFSLEDPALFFYLKNLNWEDLRIRCGFRDDEKDYEFDAAISFAGENRGLAEYISDQLNILDFSVFYDKNYEDNYLGEAWATHFEKIFVDKSRLVIAILDRHHKEKVWPTFERDCFDKRVADSAVIPIFLDDTSFPGIPKDLVSIHYKPGARVDDTEKDRVTDEIIFRIANKFDAL